MLCANTVLIVTKADKHMKYKKIWEYESDQGGRQEYVLWLRCVVLWWAIGSAPYIIIIIIINEND